MVWVRRRLWTLLTRPMRTGGWVALAIPVSIILIFYLFTSTIFRFFDVLYIVGLHSKIPQLFVFYQETSTLQAS